MESNASSFLWVNFKIKKNSRIFPLMGAPNWCRPEKDHPLQIKAMYELRQILSEEEWDQVRLLIIGGCRGHEDEKLVQVHQLPTVTSV